MTDRPEVEKKSIHQILREQEDICKSLSHLNRRLTNIRTNLFGYEDFEEPHPESFLDRSLDLIKISKDNLSCLDHQLRILENVCGVAACGEEGMAATGPQIPRRI
jgi:hypothetical protein